MITAAPIRRAVVATAVLAALFLTSRFNFLLFHSLVELFSLIVAGGIFMIAWNSRRFIDNNYLLFIGISFLFASSKRKSSTAPCWGCWSCPSSFAWRRSSP